MKPVLQLALDFVDMARAVKIAESALPAGVDWLEAGTPLIKSEGLDAVRELRRRFPKSTIVADMKIMDTGRIEVETAAKAGANIIDVLGAASDATVSECVAAGKNYGAGIIADLINVRDAVKRAAELEKLGVHYVAVHTSIDRQMHAEKPFAELSRICRTLRIPVAAAGGINSETAAQAVKSGAAILIVGGAITKSENPFKAAREIRRAMDTGRPKKTVLYKRVEGGDIISVLKKVSVANVSDAMHRQGVIPGICPVGMGFKMAGRVVTVRSYPGDWAKPVEAIDIAREGDVIVIDTGGVGPAVWGELATHSAIRKKLAGVVINGAIRDAGEIRRLKFPAFSRLIVPDAGEPRGVGEINVPLLISGIRIEPGDWITGDDDGVVVIPQDKATEFANRAMDVLEKENRIRKEIADGGTLSSVMELLKWEKKR